MRLLLVALAALNVVLRSGQLLAAASNPVIPNSGMADPHLHFFNGSFYIFASHDFSANNTGFRMDDWWIWTSQDLVSWQTASVVKPGAVFPWSNPGDRHECWATDGAYVNGTWYFYVTVGKGWDRVAVISSTSVYGPWRDPLGKPLLSVALSHTLPHPTALRDPCVFVAANGTAYIIAGVFEYYIARLNPDMVSLAEDLRQIVIYNPSGPNGAGKTDDKPFLHEHNGLHYLSWGCFYSISTTGVYGPYQYAGSVLDASAVSKDFQMGTMPAAQPPGPFTPPRPCLSGTNGSRVCACRGDNDHPNTVVLTCPNAQKVLRVLYASIGTPTGSCADGFVDSSCSGNSAAAQAYVASVCLGKHTCTLTADIGHWNKGQDPCAGVSKNIAVEVLCSGTTNGSRGETAKTATTIVQNSVLVTQPPQHKAAAGGVNCGGGWCRDTNYADRHGSFLDHGGQSYFATNDRSHSLDKHNAGLFRDTVIGYVHYRVNGTIEPVAINRTGVGQYDATTGPIEAENFFGVSPEAFKLDLRAAGGEESSGHGGFAVHGLKAGSWLHYPHTRLPAGERLLLTLDVASFPNSRSGGSVVVRDRSRGGASTVLGRCAVKPTASWVHFQGIQCELVLPAAQQRTSPTAKGVSLEFVFEAAHDQVFAMLDRFWIRSN